MRVVLPPAIQEFACNLVLRAGAGAGKTAALVEFYLDLLAGRIPGLGRLSCLEILALTYTEKAAQEMRGRIREGLFQRLQESADPGLVEELERLERAPVSTIHGFCAGLLREFALDLGLAPDFEIGDGLDLLQEATQRELIVGLDQGDPDLDRLLAFFPFQERRQGLLENLVRTLSLARSMGHTAADLAENLLREKADLPELNLGVRRRLEQALAGLAEMEFDRRNKSTPRLKALAQAGVSALESAGPVWILEQLKGQVPKAVAGIKAEIIAALEDWDRLRREPEGLLAAEAMLRVMGRVEAAFSRLKAARNRLDFDDLQLLARDLLFSRPEARNRLKERIKIVLLDETQDTNPIQWHIVNCLREVPDQARPLAPGDDPARALTLDGRKLLAVGDVKQSIYRFRGAEVADFGNLVSQFGQGRAGAVCGLDHNHRSQPGLVTFFNRFFGRHFGPAREDFQAGYLDEDRQVCCREGLDRGLVELLDTPMEQGGRKIPAPRQREMEALAVAWRIQELKAEGLPSLEGRQKIEYRDVAVLFRQMTQVGVFETIFRRLGLPYELVKGGRDRPAVRDLVNLLEYLTRPDDLFLLAALLRSPLVGLSDETLTRLALAKGIGFFAGPDPAGPPPALPLEEAEALRDFNRLLADLLAWRDRLSPAELLELALNRTDLPAVLLAGFQGRQRLAEVQGLIEAARSLAGREGLALSDAVTRLKTVLEAQGRGVEPPSLEGLNAVKLLTVHRAKGLQFPVVFVAQSGRRPRRTRSGILIRPGLGLGLRIRDRETGEPAETWSFHRLKEMEAEREAAEEKRLLYVAATRARDRLIFSGLSDKAGDEESWRAAVERFIQTDRDGLVVRSQGCLEPARRETIGRSGPDRPEPIPDEAMAKAEASIELILAPPWPLAKVSISVSALEDLHFCPRLYHRRRLMSESPPGPALAAAGLDPTRRGVWLHKILERIDFRAPGDVISLARTSAGLVGLWPDEAETAELARLVEAFLKSDTGLALSGLDPAGIRRELPFSLLRKFPAGQLQIEGEMDLLARTGEGGWLLDYKLARPAGEGYDFQLQVYGLAAQAALGRVEAGIVYLHPGGVTVKPVPFGPRERDDLESVLEELAGLLLSNRDCPDPAGWPATPRGRPQACPLLRAGCCA